MCEDAPIQQTGTPAPHSATAAAHDAGLRRQAMTRAGESPAAPAGVPIPAGCGPNSITINKTAAVGRTETATKLLFDCACETCGWLGHTTEVGIGVYFACPLCLARALSVRTKNGWSPMQQPVPSVFRVASHRLESLDMLTAKMRQQLLARRRPRAAWTSPYPKGKTK